MPRGDPEGPNGVRQPIFAWAWRHVLGEPDGSPAQLPLGEAPPKAGVCVVLFNPIYKMIFVKNTKVAGTSVLLSFGGLCPAGIDLKTAQVWLSRAPLPCRFS